MKNVNRKNVKFILACTIIIFIGVMFLENCLAKDQIKVKKIVISSNDTLWDIAQDVCDNNEKLNIQNVIIDIKEINNLQTSTIYIGQTIYIPEY
jgi:hypothetical protein